MMEEDSMDMVGIYRDDRMDYKHGGPDIDELLH